MKTRVTIAALALIACLSPLAVSASPKITVLHEGYVKPIDGRVFVPGLTSNGARRVASTVLLIEAEDALIIVDPGMVSAETDLTKQLAERGITPGDITHVFISHHHPDHTVRIGMFPNAIVADYWGSYQNDLWQDHPDMTQIAPGVSILRTPGHTDEDASLVIETAEGTYVYTHVWWTEGGPEEDPLATAPTELIESRNRVGEIADFIIPAHGKVFKNNRPK